MSIAPSLNGTRTSLAELDFTDISVERGSNVSGGTGGGYWRALRVDG